jgi:hypothetical protein
MEKLITYTLIRLFTKNHTDTVKVLNVIKSLDKPQKPKRVSYSVNPTPVKPIKAPIQKVVKPVTPTKDLSKPITETDELMESLTYFQNKSYKTKEDKESIRMIKLMLKNRK